MKEDAIVLPSPSSPLESMLATSHQEVLDRLISLRGELSSDKTSLVTEITNAINDLGARQQIDKNEILRALGTQRGVIDDLRTNQQSNKSEILGEVRKQREGEGKVFKFVLAALPVLLTVALGYWVWHLQIGTNQQIDTKGKEVATALALRAESYKRKVAVYEDADKQMAALVSVMEDLLYDSKNPRKLKLAADTEAKLSEMSKVNGLYITKPVSDGLSNVAYAAATMPTDVKGLIDKVDNVEQDMKKELKIDIE